MTGRVRNATAEDAELSSLLSSATLAQDAGRLEEAQALGRRILAVDPDHLEATLMMAGLAQGLGDLDAAMGFAAHAVEIQPKAFNGHSILGYCSLNKGDPRAAAAQLSRAISIKSDIAILHHLLGTALEQIGEREGAAQSFRRAIRLAPQVPESHIALGRVLLESGQRQEALSCFSRAYKLEPESARGLAQSAKVLTERGNHAEAEQVLLKAIALDSDSAAYRAMLGEVLMQLGQFERAREELERAISLQPKAARPYLRLCQCQRITSADRSMIERVMALAEDLSFGPNDRRYLHYALGKSFDDLGEFEKAIRHFDSANELMLQLARPTFDRERHSARIDGTVRTFTRELFRRNRSVGSDSETPVLVVGMLRSGTTLVEQIVSSHPDVGAAGELQFWTDVARKPFDPADAPVAADLYLRHLEEVATGKTRVIDKFPNNFLSLGHVHLALPNARIIHCRRSPLDNGLSIYLTPFSQPVNYAHGRSNIVFWYREYLRLMEHWRAVLPPDRFLEVDYEDIVQNREPTTRAIIDFLGLEWTDLCLHPESNDRAVRTPSMWQVRQPVYRSSIGRRRNYEPWLGELRDLAIPGER